MYIINYYLKINYKGIHYDHFLKSKRTKVINKLLRLLLKSEAQNGLVKATAKNPLFGDALVQILLLG